MTESKVVDAKPTKEFFISMLIKDIPLIRAIIDLVDNSIDGARRLRGNESYSGLQIDITISNNQFTISDNCGGMSIDVASDYAFRFGRPTFVDATPHSVGLFGVGMKRAIFKMGRKFSVKSHTLTSSFKITEDINEWAKDDGSWQFTFDMLDENAQNDTVGTVIEITDLHPTISETFSQDNFINDLSSQLQEAQQAHLENGLSIKLNGIEIQPESIKLLVSEEISPAKYTRTIESLEGNVDVEIYAGIAERSPADAGWYIFCNKRLVLHANKGKVTGWGLRNEVPQYHNDYAAFRGFVYFESEDAALLPWTTTKTDIDTDSPVFKAILLDMMVVMEPVLGFLRNLVKERRQIGEDGPLQAAVAESKPTAIKNLDTNQPTFSAPAFVAEPDSPDVVNIAYKVPRDKAEVVRVQIGATSYREVGEQTFEYYFLMKCED